MPPPARAKRDTRAIKAGEDAAAARLSNRGSDAVARRAYELFCGRGRAHGHDLDDWLRAERELAEQSGERAGT
jgi:hypothetical protein